MVREVSGDGAEGRGVERRMAVHSGAGLALELLDVLSAQHNYQLPYLPLNFLTPSDGYETMEIFTFELSVSINISTGVLSGRSIVLPSNSVDELLSDAAFNAHFGFCCRQHILFINSNNIYNTVW